MSIERHVPELARPGHKPLLLVDGARETPKDRKYLADYHRRLAERMAYVTIPDSDHYANSWGLVGASFYDALAVRRTVDALDGWMREVTEASACPTRRC